MSNHNKQKIDSVAFEQLATIILTAPDLNERRDDLLAIVNQRNDEVEICASCQENPATVTQPLTGVKYCEGCYWGQAEAV